jgi:DNA-directed RNA polymerase subunit beta
MFLSDFADKTNTQLKDIIIRKIKEMYPIENANRKITLEHITVDIPKEAYDPETFSDKKATKSNISMTANMKLNLIDKESNKTIDSKTIKLKIPAMNLKGTFLVGGNEYLLPTQLRLKPGIYTRVRENGEIVSEFKMEKGENFKVVLNPNKNTLRIDQGRQIKLIPFLKGMGVTEAQMKQAWGAKEFDTLNQSDGNGDPEKEVQKVLEKDFSRMYQWMWKDIDPEASPQDKIKEYMKKTELNPKITNITLEKEHSKADIQAIMDAAKRVIQISKEEKKPSGMSSTVFKKANKPIHYIEEKLGEMDRVLNSSVKKRMSQFDDLHKIISPAYTQKIFDDFFLTSSVSQIADQPNPIGLLTNLGKTTLTGEGAIEQDRAITKADRSVDPYHFAFLDPVHTPESEKIGSNLYATSGTLSSIYNDPEPELKNSFYNFNTNKVEKLSPIDVYDKVLAFPGEITSKQRTGKIVKAIHKGEIKNVKDTEVDIMLTNASSMFDASTNILPFLQSINGNRAMMASKHLTHAIPIEDPEEPFVQSIIPGTKNTFEQSVGQTTTAKSTVDGVVTSVSENRIMIKDNNGKEHKISLLSYLETGDSTFLKQKPIVKPGDKVKKGQLIAESNVTKNGTLALGKNLKVAYVPYKGHNYEDGIVISQSAAKKLSSEHLHNFKVEITPGLILDKNKFKAYFPQEYTTQQLNNLDEQGIIKKGATINNGDPLALVMAERSQSLHEKLIGDLHKQLMAPVRNKAVEWDKSVKGEVVKVVKQPSLIQIMVRSVEPVIAGDKIVGRHGNKGTVAQIIPDAEMPKDESGENMEILMNPAGIPSRINPSQILETAAAKIAKKTGKPYNVENFKPGTNYLEQIKADLKKYGIKDKEFLTDPNIGKLEEPVLTGYQYIVKLPQQVEHKTNIREEWGYDADKRPLKGGGEGGGARALDPLTSYALMAHNARANLREMATYKAEQNDDFWFAIENGQIPPAPKPTFAFNKFTGYLKGAGINVTKSGNNLQLSPMKDSDITSMSNGEVKTPDTIKGYNMTPEKGGIFDVDTLGGLQGDKWGHIKLSEPILNPTFEKQTRKLLNLKTTEFNALTNGSKGIDKNGNIVDADKADYFGGEAFKHMLSKIDPDKELNSIRQKLSNDEKIKPNEVDNLLYKAKILRGFKDTNTSPQDYVVNNLPVIPPKYRPVYPSQDEKFVVVSPINHLYKDTILLNNQIKEAKDSKILTPEDQNKLSGELYQQAKALVGMRDPLPFTQSQKEGASGALKFLAGNGSPKSGYFQSKVLSKRQELSSNLVIQNGPELDLDEAAIPEDAAWSLYKPFLVKKIQDQGYNIKEAKDMIKQRDPLARKMLEEETENRPVLLNRSPSLHKFSVMAFKPKITQDQVIRLNPSVVGGFNADFDGDSSINSVFVEFLKVDKFKRLGYDLIGGGNMPFDKLSLRTKTGLVNLKDFPRIKESKRVEGNKEIYDVPKDIKILASKDGKTGYYPIESFSIHKNLEIIEVKTNTSRTIQCSKDHSLITVDKDLNYIKHKPEKNITIPRIRKPVEGHAIESIVLHDKQESQYDFNFKIPLDEKWGYVNGVYVGDGWIDKIKNKKSYGIHLANVSNELFEDVQDTINSYINDGNKINFYIKDNPHDFNGFESFSRKMTWFSKTFHHYFGLLGHKAQNKHLPKYWLHAPEDFRWGLLGGLIDTDGTINYNKTNKGTKRMTVGYYTTSRTLAFEVVALASSLNLTASATPTFTPKKEESWTITFTQESIVNMKNKIKLRVPEKQKLIKEFEPNKDYDRNKYTPKLSKKRLDELRKAIGSPRLRNKKGELMTDDLEKQAEIKHKRSLNAICARILKNNTALTKKTALEIFDLGLELFEKDDFWKKWKEMVLDENIEWELITETKALPEITEAYDLTAGPMYTMVTENGFIIQDTMALHIPVTEEARQESLRMTPSKNLFKPASGSLMNNFSLEYNGAIYNLTKAPQNEEVKNTQANDFRQLFQELQSNKLRYNDIINFHGRKSTVGRHLVNELFPEKYRDYNNRWDKKIINSKLQTIAKENPDKAVEILNNLKEIARYAMYKIPFSVSINDLTLPNAKPLQEKILSLDSSNIPEKQKLKELEKLDNEVTKLIDQSALTNTDSNGFLHMKASGTKGSTSQIKQLLVGPVRVQNNFGNPIPAGLGKSYGEGLTPAQYFSASYGARMGMLAKKLGVSEPGALNKEILNSVADQVVTQFDDPNDPGVPFKLSEESDKDMIGRRLAKDIIDKRGKIIAKKGEEVTSHMLSMVRNHNIKYIYLKSPLSDTAPKGMSGTSFGIDETGKIPDIGINIGIKNTQAITEPLSQGALNFFHTGGVSSTESTMSTYDTINTMTKLTQTFKANSAVLSQVTGTVEKVERQSLGGYAVTVDGLRHIIPPGLRPKVKKGDKIRKGEPLSTGMIHPENAFNARGMGYARQTMSNQFKNALKKDINVNSSTVETLVRGLTSSVEILNPGQYRNKFDVGDVVQGQYVDYLNRKATNTKKKVDSSLIGWMVGDNYEHINVGTPIDRNILKELQELGLKEIMAYKEVIKYRPIIRGTTTLPHKKSDWLQRSSFRGLKNALSEEAAFGGKADLHGTSPITAWSYGAEIRQDEKGQY